MDFHELRDHEVRTITDDAKEIGFEACHEYLHKKLDSRKTKSKLSLNIRYPFTNLVTDKNS